MACVVESAKLPSRPISCFVSAKRPGASFAGRARRATRPSHRQGHPRLGLYAQAALQAGFSSAGVDIVLCGPIPTPAVAYLTRALRLDAGVVISASHNPYDDNGIKFFSGEGTKFPDAVELEIEDELDAGRSSSACRRRAGQGPPARRCGGPVHRVLQVDDRLQHRS